MATHFDARSTLGAIYAGCMGSVGLSAIVAFQTFLYFQIFPNDSVRYKLLVAWVWATDAAHTVSICTAVWQYGILNFANRRIFLDIESGMVAMAFLSGMISLSVNLFYASRIHQMSKQNWFITIPILLLCVGRVVMTFFLAIEMAIEGTYANVISKFSAIPILVGAVSAGTDVVISTARYYYLRDLKQGYLGTPEMVDAVVIFTINDGLLSCALVLGVMACFLTMKDNYVWIGLFFVVPKVYSNSVLATLNLRNWYQHLNRPLGLRPQVKRNTFQDASGGSGQSIDKGATDTTNMAMEVFVDQEVEFNVGSLNFSAPTRNGREPHQVGRKYMMSS